MKNKLLLLFALFVILPFTGIWAQVIRDIKPEKLNEVEISGPFNIYFSKSTESSIKIVASENVDDLIDINLSDGKLKLSSKDNLKNATNYVINSSIDIFISYTDLKAISVNGIGKIETLTPMLSENLKLDMNGVSKCRIDMNVNYLDVTISGIGDYAIVGKADNVNANFSGIGSFDLHALTAKTMSLNSSGIGYCDVYASEELNINTSGIGNVTYSGSAAKIIINKSGLGSVTKK
jgi:hypothetical protein